MTDTVSFMMPKPEIGDDDYDVKVRLRSLTRLDGLDAGRWGWVIVRTVYTPESDGQIPTAVECLRKNFVNGFRGSWCTIIDRSLYDEVEQRLDLTVIEDAKRLDKASISTVREVFAQWSKERLQRHEITPVCLPRFRNCIMLDERGLREVMAIHALPEKDWTLTTRPECVKLVEWAGTEGEKLRRERDWRDCGVVKIPVVWISSEYNTLSTTCVIENLISGYMDDERLPLSYDLVTEMQEAGIQLQPLPAIMDAALVA